MTRASIQHIVVSAVLLSCSNRREAFIQESATLGGEVVARVNLDEIPKSLVATVALTQRIPPGEAIRRLTDDAVASNGARSLGYDKLQPALWTLSAGRARWMADQLLAEARRGGPPTDAEIEELTRLHWREVDRPPAVRVIHALAKRPTPTSNANDARARTLAEALRTAVLASKDAASFEAAAKNVPHPSDVEVIVESLPAFASDGAMTEERGSMVEAFAKAAHSLHAVGETSDIVETNFGWHVIRLLETVPEQRMAFDARREAFSEEVITRRASTAIQSRVRELRKTFHVEVLPTAEPLMLGISTQLAHTSGSAAPL